MFRTALAPDAGMIFEMPRDQQWGFYMRNTLIPLDMIFIDRDWRVVGIVANAPPLTEETRQVDGESRFVLELAAHRAAQLHLAAGTQLLFTRLPDQPAPTAAP